MDLFNHIVVELFDSRTRLEWESSTCDSSDPPSHDALLDFITKRMLTLKAAKPKNIARVSGDSSRSAKTHFSRQWSDSLRCSLCSERHSLMQCSQFKAKSASERKAIVEASRVCFNCLGNHPVAKCQSSRNCWTCKARHHSMLHDAYASPQSTRISTLSAVSKADDRKAILLATARVLVKDRRGNSVRVLIDQGSEVSIISEALVQRLRLPRAHTTVSIIGIGNSHSGSTRGKVTVSISSNVTGNSFSAVAFILPRLSAYQGSSTKKITAPWSHIPGLPLADPQYFENDPVELLLGAEVCSTIFEEGLCRGRPQEPIAQKTTLGWILSGGCDAASLQHQHGSFTCSADHDLIKLVHRFWEQEQEPVAPVRLTPEEEKCEDLFVSSHTRTQAGRYVVRLPFFSTPTALTNIRKPAERLLTAMERKCRQDAGFGDLYRAFMREYEDLKHMELVNASPEQENKALCYLPHHGVLRESSVTIKLRVFFNGSQSAGSEKSLNQQLLTGANLLPALADVLLRWRRHRFALIADVEKMYRQILVHPADRDYQRILWRPDSTDVIREYRLNTVTYGLACAPFLAIRTLRQLADDEDARFPRGASTLRQDCYVDDNVTGADTVLDTIALQEELRKLCMAGGFPLRKWASNCQEALHGIPHEHQLQKSSHSWEDESHGTLGLRWHPRSDHFSFAIHPHTITQFTKRRVLSETARLFDPLGWLAPVVIRAKIFIQSAWLQGLEWDTPLPTADSLQWKLFFEELPILERVRMDRWLKTDDRDSSIEIHDFADASERGYAAAVYLRVQDNSSALLYLLAAKSKVAPVKQVSLPRLELCAAALLTGLTLHIRNTLSLSTAPVFLWSDSRVTLCWIRGHASRWKTYVANRVAHIQLSLPEAQWRHVPGRVNPADCASRGIAPSELINHPLWWTGPAWLREDMTAWPINDFEDQGDELPEKRAVNISIAKEVITEPEFLLRCSSLHRLLRVTAWCCRWRLTIARRNRTPGSNTLQPDELDAALIRWLRTVQEIHYPAEVAAVAAGRIVSSRSQLAKLGPFRDDNGVLRVGGRLKHAMLSLDERHPMIAPPASWFTRLLVDSHHRRTLHGGVQLTLGLLRLRFWVPRGRTVVKQLLHRSKAVHLEAVSDYSTEAFLAAFRRFIARRGLCTDIYSDCGTNFVGADRELRKLFRASSADGRRIAQSSGSHGIKWHFNPPAAPHFGGLWEAAVKSTKHHLRRIIGETTLIYEEMSTFLTQVEACLNSRPLNALSDDPDDLIALTPGHLLIGAPLLAVPEPALTTEKENTLTRWQLLQRMREHFWQRWSQEYLHGLASRPKWLKPETLPRVGALCLLRSENTPPNRWPLARITKLHPGDDGVVRVVTVRTSTSELTRPVVKLVLLPGVTDASTSIEDA